jgi:hypothetical protein
VITPRDPAGSEPPSNMRLVRTSRYYELYRRIGPTPTRRTLAEGPEPGAVLNCATAGGRALSRERGEAAVRAPNVEVPGPGLLPGATGGVQLPLTRGRWLLSALYASEHPIDVAAPGLRTTLPANLDRPGARWWIGPVTVTTSMPTVVTFHVHDAWLAAPIFSTLDVVVATLDVPDRMVPLRQACGRDVDWYTVG